MRTLSELGLGLIPIFLPLRCCGVLISGSYVAKAKAERPVVATAVSGIPELVVDDKTGILIPPRDVQAIEDGLGTILADPEKGRKMGIAGRERILELDLSWEKYALRTIGIYEGLVGQ